MGVCFSGLVMRLTFGHGWRRLSWWNGGGYEVTNRYERFVSVFVVIFFEYTLLLNICYSTDLHDVTVICIWFHFFFFFLRKKRNFPLV